MAGHSKFKNIQHRKGAQDKKRAKIFTKLVREIIIAAKIGGIDVVNNPRLRTAISGARSHNLPKDRIDKALSQATDANDGENYSEIRYEAFMPGGIALIVEALTDNKNRTVSEVRNIINKAGGNLGESGSVSFMFDRLGMIQFAKETINKDTLFDKAIEAGASDIESDDETHNIYTEVVDFTDCLDNLSESIGMPQESGVIWRPQSLIMIEDEEQMNKILRCVDNLEDNDDVQSVFGNYDFSDELLAKLKL